VAVALEGEDAGSIAVEVGLPGIVWSTAAVGQDGSLWVGTDDDRLYGIEPSGEIRTVVRLGDCEPPRAFGPVGVWCDVDGGPTVAPDGTLWVGADGVYQVAGDGAVLGHVGSPGGRAPHVYAAPLLAGDAVVFGAQDGSVQAVARDRTPRWRVELGADVDGAPALGRDGTIYVGVDDGRVVALTDRGEIRWTFQTGLDVRGALTVGGDGTIHVTSLDGSLYALHPDGSLRFRVPTDGPIAAPAVIDGEGNIFFTSRDDRLWSVAHDGRVRWTVDLATDVDGGVTLAPGRTLVTAGDDGRLRIHR
jgi:outer membrane protein assembly factor BamB